MKSTHIKRGFEYYERSTDRKSALLQLAQQDHRPLRRLLVLSDAQIGKTVPRLHKLAVQATRAPRPARQKVSSAHVLML
eukprot:435231-Amphidinium_carterae.1